MALLRPFSPPPARPPRNSPNWFLAWLAGFVTLALVLGLLHLPILFGFLAAAGAFFVVARSSAGGARRIQAPRRPDKRVDWSRIQSGRASAARAILGDSVPEAERLVAAGKAIRKPLLRKQVIGLAVTANRIFEGVAEDPERLAKVQRFLAYYLPSAAEIAEGYRALENQRTPDPARLAQTEDMISRLQNAFENYADSMMEDEIQSLDLEMKMLEKNLKEDLGSSSPEPAPMPGIAEPAPLRPVEAMPLEPKPLDIDITPRSAPLSAVGVEARDDSAPAIGFDAPSKTETS